MDNFLKTRQPTHTHTSRIASQGIRSERMFAGRCFTQNIQPAHGKKQNIPPAHKKSQKIKSAHSEPTSSHISSNYPPNFPQVASSHAQAGGGRRLYPEAVDMEGQVYVDGLKKLSPALTSDSSIHRNERNLLGGRSG